jgi:O-antigen ligase
MSFNQRERAGGRVEELTFAAAIVFALATMVSASATFSVALPLGPAWKRFVLADLAFVVLLAVFVLSRVVGGPDARRIRHWRAPLAVLAGIGVAVALSPAPARGLPDLARFAYSLAAFVILAQLDLDRARVRRFAAWYVAGAAIICMIAVAAYVAHATAGWSSALVEVGTGPRDQAHIARRMQGPFAHPNALAVFLTSAIFFTGVLWRQTESRRRKSLLVLLLVVDAIVLFLTSSRNMASVLIALFVWSTLSAHERPRHGARTLALGVLAAAWLLVVVVSIVWAIVPVTIVRDPETRFVTVRVYTGPEGRALIYRAGFGMFLDYPLAGVGPGFFGEHFRRYVSLDELHVSLRHVHRGSAAEIESVRALHQIGPDPHSSWIGWLARTGLVGFVPLVWFFGSLAARAFRARTAPGLRGALAAATFAFLVALLWDGLTVEILHLRFLWVFFAFAAIVTDPEFS